jgi:hypothetical protein
MFDEISMKAFGLIGPLTEADSTYLRERDIKYQLVRFMVKEKLNHDGPNKTSNFQFSPGEGFMDKPIYDIVHGIIEMFEELAAGKLESESFGFGEDLELDSYLLDNPPHTGRKKTAL